MHSKYAAVGHWCGGFDESKLQDWARGLRARLPASRVNLGLVFMSTKLQEHAQTILEVLRVHAQVPLLMGCTSNSLVAEDKEYEDTAGLVLGLYELPGATLTAARFTQEQIEVAEGPDYWQTETGVSAAKCNGWLAFLDPFHMDCENWVKQWNESYQGRPILGGLASGEPNESRTMVFLNGEVFESGGVAVAFQGNVELKGIISQGCTPIGDTWTITKAERNLIFEIGNRRAYEILLDTYNSMTPKDQQKTRGNVLIGLVTNEYLEEFHRGDFLVRNLLGADPRSGILAVGALPRRGQTIQFQRRDAEAASEDMQALLARAREQLGETLVYGGCLCSCNGRGHRLFNIHHHDASMIFHYFGKLGLTGFFCNGEVGPVGERNFLHGYTASLALFVPKNTPPVA